MTYTKSRSPCRSFVRDLTHGFVMFFDGQSGMIPHQKCALPSGLFVPASTKAGVPAFTVNGFTPVPKHML